MAPSEVSHADFQELAGMVKQVRDCLMVSTPERGCVLDSIRKHDAQIAALECAPRRGPMDAIVDAAIRTATTTIMLLVLTLIAKGFLVSVVADAIKLVAVK